MQALITQRFKPNSFRENKLRCYYYLLLPLSSAIIFSQGFIIFIFPPLLSFFYLLLFDFYIVVVVVTWFFVPPFLQHRVFDAIQASTKRVCVKLNKWVWGYSYAQTLNVDRYSDPKTLICMHSFILFLLFLSPLFLFFYSKFKEEALIFLEG